MLIASGDRSGRLSRVELQQTDKPWVVDAEEAVFVAVIDPALVRGRNGRPLDFAVDLSAALFAESMASDCGCQGSVDHSPAVLLPGDQCAVPSFFEHAAYAIDDGTLEPLPEGVGRLALESLRLVVRGSCGCGFMTKTVADPDRVHMCALVPTDWDLEAVALAPNGTVLVSEVDGKLIAIDRFGHRARTDVPLDFDSDRVLGPLSTTGSSAVFLILDHPTRLTSANTEARLVFSDGMTLTSQPVELGIPELTVWRGARYVQSELLIYGGVRAAPSIVRCHFVRGEARLACTPEEIDPCAVGGVDDLDVVEGRPPLAATDRGSVIARDELGVWRCLQFSPSREGASSFEAVEVSVSDSLIAIAERFPENDQRLLVARWSDAEPRPFRDFEGDSRGLGFVRGGSLLLAGLRVFEPDPSGFVRLTSLTVQEALGADHLGPLATAQTVGEFELVADIQSKVLVRKLDESLFRPMFHSFPESGEARTALVDVSNGLASVSRSGQELQLVDVPSRPGGCDDFKLERRSIEGGKLRPNAVTRFAVRAVEGSALVIGGRVDAVDPARGSWVQSVDSASGRVLREWSFEEIDALAAAALGPEVTVLLTQSGDLLELRADVLTPVTIEDDDPATAEAESGSAGPWLSLTGGPGFGWATGVGRIARLVDGGATVRAETYWLQRIQTAELLESFRLDPAPIRSPRSFCPKELAFLSDPSGSAAEGWVLEGREPALHRLALQDAFLDARLSGAWLGPALGLVFFSGVGHTSVARFVAPFSVVSGATSERSFLLGGALGELGAGWVDP